METATWDAAFSSANALMQMQLNYKIWLAKATDEDLANMHDMRNEYLVAITNYVKHLNNIPKKERNKEVWISRMNFLEDAIHTEYKAMQAALQAQNKAQNSRKMGHSIPTRMVRAMTVYGREDADADADAANAPIPTKTVHRRSDTPYAIKDPTYIPSPGKDKPINRTRHDKWLKEQGEKAMREEEKAAAAATLESWAASRRRAEREAAAASATKGGSKKRKRKRKTKRKRKMKKGKTRRRR